MLFLKIFTIFTTSPNPALIWIHKDNHQNLKTYYVSSRALKTNVLNAKKLKFPLAAGETEGEDAAVLLAVGKGPDQGQQSPSSFALSPDPTQHLFSGCSEMCRFGVQEMEGMSPVVENLLSETPVIYQRSQGYGL